VDKDPVLIEIGARPMGAQQPAFVEQSLGHSQIDLGVLAYLAPDRFAEYAKEHPIYSAPRDKKTVVFTLMTPEKNLVYHPNIEKILRGLSTYVKHRLFDRMGKPLPVTIDLQTAAGDIWLEGSEADVNADIQKLVALEQLGLFKKQSLCARVLSSVSSFLELDKPLPGNIHGPYYRLMPRI
jgi:hypothetical protein